MVFMKLREAPPELIRAGSFSSRIFV